jgi:adenylate cyclase
MVNRGVERRLAAILAADVVGYSRLMATDEADTHARLKALRQELLEPTVAEHRGRMVKLTGDGALVEFASVVNAVHCALAIQHGMAAKNADLADADRFELRIGINLGDIILDEDDIYGDGVNLAARLEALAEPGGICLSSTVVDHLRGKVAVELEDLGERRLKNIPEAVRVHRVRMEAGTGVRSDRPLRPMILSQDKPSIAVLPFDVLSPDPQDGFFADGMAAEIVTALSKISSIRVIARHSSFAYRGQSTGIRQFAKELTVRYALEGTIRRAGRRLRITAQLIDAEDGAHLWADRYDRTVEDVFDIQDEITKEIVTALRVQLTDGELALAWSRGTTNVEAWQLCVRATELHKRFTTSDYLEARRLAERAVELDPAYAYAWATLGFTWWWDGRLGFTGDSEAKFAKANEFADRAMACDSTVSEVMGLKSMASAALGDHEQAVALAERNVAQYPGNADVRGFLAFALIWAGRHAEALATIRAAMELNPHHPTWYLNGLARALAAVGRIDEALRVTAGIISRNPRFFQAHLLQALLLGRQGRMEEARRAVREVRKLAPHFRTHHLRYLNLAKDDETVAPLVALLQEAGLPA